MYDYMRALHKQFCAEPTSECKRTADDLYQELLHRLDREDRKLLLRLMDARIAYEDENSLASFTAGFRLAVALARELSFEDPYSFDQEEERHAVEALERRNL